MALLLRERKGTKTGGGRFRVSGRVVADVRLAHSTMRAPHLDDFPLPRDLLPEEQALHQAAAAAYCALFGDAPACLLDIDEWETIIGDVRLVGQAGVPLTLPDGTIEIRQLKLGGRVGTPSDADMRFMALRVEQPSVRVVTADLVRVDRHVSVIDGVHRHDPWLRDRVRALETHADEDRPVAGPDCGWCAFTADCAAHRE